MGTDLPNAGAPLGATRGGRRIVFVIIEAPPRFKICARDMRAGRQSTRREKPMSTRTDDDVESPTDDVVGASFGLPTGETTKQTISDPARIFEAQSAGVRGSADRDR